MIRCGKVFQRSQPSPCFERVLVHVGDWESRGLNHLAKEKDGHPPMLRRTIGGHYGQVPMVAQLALDEKIEAWTLPMGSVSRMIRAQSTHSPGHITSVGIGARY